MTVGKLIGFLGMTAEITGYELEPTFLAMALLGAAALQVLKNLAEHEESVKRRNASK